MPDDDRQRLLPPYVPWRTFETYIDSLKAFGSSLPNVIDRDSMRTFSGATQSWLLGALRSLKMVDEKGVPRPRLKQIVDASPEDRKGLYRQVIEAEYKFLDGINLQGATPRQIDAAFESTGATGDTVRKCIGFFVGMAKAADIPLSPLIEKARRRQAKPANGAGKPKRAVADQKPPTPHVQTNVRPLATENTTAKPAYQVLYELLDPEMDEAEQSAVWTLLRYVKRKEATG
jgi:hypothetical protein